MESKKITLTTDGLKKLEDELEYLKTKKRKEVSEKIKVALGFGVGGTEFEKFNAKKFDGGEPKNMFGGGTGGGISLTPEAFLVVGNGKIRMISVTPQNGVYDRLLDLAPAAIDKVAEIFKRGGKDSEPEISVEYAEQPEEKNE